MAVEIGLSLYDAYSTVQTLRDSNASGAEKAVSVGGFAAGLALPGGGYGTAGKQVVKHADDVAGAVKGIKAFDPVAQQQKMLRGIENSSVVNTIKDTFKTSDTIPGGTMGALRNEIMTGSPTKGIFHGGKVDNTTHRIENLIKNSGPQLNKVETGRLNGILNSLNSLKKHIKP